MCTDENYSEKLKRIGELLNAVEGTPEYEELLKLTIEVEEFENTIFFW